MKIRLIMAAALLAGAAYRTVRARVGQRQPLGWKHQSQLGLDQPHQCLGWQVKSCLR